MKKIQIISDNNKKSQKFKSQIIKLINKSNLKNLNIVIVVGGDGFMLQTLKKNRNNKKCFYGVNSGNYGFLMNKFSSKNTIKNFSRAKKITISPIEMKVINKQGLTKKSK